MKLIEISFSTHLCVCARTRARMCTHMHACCVNALLGISDFFIIH